MVNWLVEMGSTSLAVVGQNFGNDVKSITAVRLSTDVANSPMFPKVFRWFITSIEELPTICNEGKQIEFFFLQTNIFHCMQCHDHCLIIAGRV